jgi:hypothetical protein
MSTPTDSTDHGWTIEHIEIEPITPAHHASAVAALSALITEWNERKRPA